MSNLQKKTIFIIPILLVIFMIFLFLSRYSFVIGSLPTLSVLGILAFMILKADKNTMKKSLKIVLSLVLLPVSFGPIILHSFSDIGHDKKFYDISGQFNNISQLENLIKEGFYRTAIMNLIELSIFILIPSVFLLTLVDIWRREKIYIKALGSLAGVYIMVQSTNFIGAHLAYTKEIPLWSGYFEKIKYENADNYFVIASRESEGFGYTETQKISYKTSDSIETIKNSYRQRGFNHWGNPEDLQISYYSTLANDLKLPIEHRRIITIHIGFKLEDGSTIVNSDLR